MDIVPRKKPRILLSEITAPEPDVDPAKEAAESPFAMHGSRFFSGNGRAIFTGIIVSGILLSIAGAVYNRHQRLNGGEPLSVPRFLQARTRSVSASLHELVAPKPVIVPIDAELLHVSGISLGHPRLAVINGQSVAEGDWVKASLANLPVTVSLKVLKIGDGRIDLTDGRQIITTRFSITPSEPIR